MKPLLLARLLIIATFLALMRSPPLANLCLVILLVLMAVQPALRARLRATWGQPMARGAAVLGAVLALGVSYSAGTWSEALHQLWVWRTLFFMLIACALFNEERWKRIALRSLAGVSALVALSVLGLSMWQAWQQNGRLTFVSYSLVRNYATQSMVFTVALVACGVLFQLDGGRLRRLWLACAVVLLLAITLASEGRSGYVVLLAAVGVYTWGTLREQNHSHLRALVTAAGVAALGLALLAASPVARQRTSLGVSEVQNYEQQTGEGTSMGLRMIFWQDAVTLIRQKPLLGWGTGSYGAAQRQLVAGRSGVPARETVDPHNQFLKIAAETGLLGLAALFFLFFSLARQRPSAPYRIAGLAILAGWCATSLANSHFSTFVEGHFLFLWLGLTLAPEPGPEAGAAAA